MPSRTLPRRRDRALTPFVQHGMFAVALVFAGCKPSGIASRTPRERIEALAAMTHQAEIASIAENDPDLDVRRAALERLSDEELVCQVAVASENSIFAREALARLSNDSVIAIVAVSGKAETTRREALARVVDQSSLAEVALHSSERDERKAALDRIEKDSSLVRICLESRDFIVAQSAAAKLHEQESLIVVATAKVDRDRFPMFDSVRLRAVERLEDQACLAQLAVNDPWTTIRFAAYARLADPSLAQVDVPDVQRELLVMLFHECKLLEDWPIRNSTFDHGLQILKALDDPTIVDELGRTTRIEIGVSVEGPRYYNVTTRVEHGVSRVNIQASHSPYWEARFGWLLRSTSTTKLSHAPGTRCFLSLRTRMTFQEAALTMSNAAELHARLTSTSSWPT
jgi:hypothetical protein